MRYYEGISLNLVLDLRGASFPWNHELHEFTRRVASQLFANEINKRIENAIRRGGI